MSRLRSLLLGVALALCLLISAPQGAAAATAIAPPDATVAAGAYPVDCFCKRLAALLVGVIGSKAHGAGAPFLQSWEDSLERVVRTAQADHQHFSPKRLDDHAFQNQRISLRRADRFLLSRATTSF